MEERLKIGIEFTNRIPNPKDRQRLCYVGGRDFLSFVDTGEHHFSQLTERGLHEKVSMGVGAKHESYARILGDKIVHRAPHGIVFLGFECETKHLDEREDFIELLSYFAQTGHAVTLVFPGYSEEALKEEERRYSPAPDDLVKTWSNFQEEDEQRN